MKLATHANRGMALEQLIEYANAQYAAKGLAVIQKVATPWKVIRKGTQIVSAFPEKKSTVDFIGTFRGKPIAFDAKQTENKTSFPLSNMEQHQLDFMRDWENNGGKSFFLIEFRQHGEIWYLDLDNLVEYKNKAERKSIAHEHMPLIASRVKTDNGIVLDYLKYCV